MIPHKSKTVKFSPTLLFPSFHLSYFTNAAILSSTNHLNASLNTHCLSFEQLAWSPQPTPCILVLPLVKPQIVVRPL